MSFRAVRLLRVPFGGGQPRYGTELGPAALLTEGLIPRLSAVRSTVDDTELPVARRSDEDTTGPARNIATVSDVNERIAAECSKCEEDAFMLMVGGDHSCALGSVAGALLRDPDARVLWVDAHVDLNTPATSPSGNMHGMPLSLLMDIDDVRSKYSELSWLSDVPKLLADRIAWIGLRDVDAFEADKLRELGCHAWTMDDVAAAGGVDKATQLALAALYPDGSATAGSLHVSFDIDALDADVAPSTGTPVAGGFTLDEGISIVHAAAKTARLRSLDVVEVNPLLRSESARQTAEAGVQLAVSCVSALQ
eukprot:PLAT5125.1.p1 GENE.PLAT5125.1~~PLAT5125.1.p1  ORF type:complete len:308 (-),score=111.53 PLAT5125.1:28-951(-)